MAGGTWTAQNKIRPGVYINFRGHGGTVAAPGARGTAAICRALSWGPVGEIMTIEAGADTTPFTGYSSLAPQTLFLREMFKGSDGTDGPTKVLLYRPAAAGAAAASASLEGGVTITARYTGTRGNGISIVISERVDEPGTFTVTTLVDGVQADQQYAKTPAGLHPNAWVTFSEEGTLTATAGVMLSGGSDGEAGAAAYAAFLDALEPFRFDILAYDGADSTVNQAMISFVKRISSQEGRYTQLVTTNAENADSRFVINNCSGVVLEDGTVLTPQETVWWLAGAEAGAQYYQSLSCASYPGAADVSPRMTGSQIEEAILAGSVVLSEEFGRVSVETDINTLVSFSQEIGEVFHKNRAMRSCSSLANDLYRTFSLHYRGKVANNEAGRGLFKGAVLDYLLEMHRRGALRQLPVGDDVEVLAGDSTDSIVINLGLWLADAVEKIYMTITVS